MPVDPESPRGGSGSPPAGDPGRSAGVPNDPPAEEAGPPPPAPGHSRAPRRRRPGRAPAADTSPAGEPPADEPASDEPGRRVAVSLEEIRSLLAGLTETVGREHERAAHRERVIDRLHEDNQRLRHGELQTAFEPVRAALYRLYDLVRREAERETVDPAHTPVLLAAIAEELAEILARTGVEPMPVETGEAFDPARHRPAGTQDVDDAELDGTVARVQRAGFVRGDRIARRAEVIVARMAAEPVGGE
ncbi:nucleotide exchange factor GrpE [Actinoallomurus soli]|uniref:nucleotide exchange factor GrpE n=1 Tax=Actinoallomurus soli TaxID=2952535 RepID=UPI0020924DCE|nr:nucleotide exchange factor GrpE [Actinoallomurus soli]MCO5969664.1 nucleotide exchange factor GrpE [Actinoallomurus soli]